MALRKCEKEREPMCSNDCRTMDRMMGSTLTGPSSDVSRLVLSASRWAKTSSIFARPRKRLRTARAASWCGVAEIYCQKIKTCERGLLCNTPGSSYSWAGPGAWSAIVYASGDCITSGRVFKIRSWYAKRISNSIALRMNARRGCWTVNWRSGILRNKFKISHHIAQSTWNAPFFPYPREPEITHVHCEPLCKPAGSLDVETVGKGGVKFSDRLSDSWSNC